MLNSSDLKRRHISKNNWAGMFLAMHGLSSSAQTAGRVLGFSTGTKTNDMFKKQQANNQRKIITLRLNQPVKYMTSMFWKKHFLKIKSNWRQEFWWAKFDETFCACRVLNHSTKIILYPSSFKGLTTSHTTMECTPLRNASKLTNSSRTCTVC